jgi:hypothetical protein
MELVHYVSKEFWEGSVTSTFLKMLVYRERLVGTKINIQFSDPFLCRIATSTDCACVEFTICSISKHFCEFCHMKEMSYII